MQRSMIKQWINLEKQELEAIDPHFISYLLRLDFLERISHKWVKRESKAGTQETKYLRSFSLARIYTLHICGKKRLIASLQEIPQKFHHPATTHVKRKFLLMIKPKRGWHPSRAVSLNPWFKKMRRPGHNVNSTLRAYLIIVADAADAASVTFSGRCKFLQI